MMSKTLQFHALPEDVPDLLLLLAESVPDVHLYVWSGEIGLTRSRTSEVEFVRCPPDSSVIASIEEIDLSVTTMSDLLRDFPGALHMDIPYVANGAVREVCAGAKIWDQRGAHQLKAWSKFFRRLRSTFHSGAFVSMPKTGLGRYYKNAHATIRAVQASSKGIRLQAIAGDAEYNYSVLDERRLSNDKG